VIPDEFAEGGWWIVDGTGFPKKGVQPALARFRRMLGLYAFFYVVPHFLAFLLLGLLHFFWMKAAKNNFGEWSIYAVVLAFLLGWRVVRHVTECGRQMSSPRHPPPRRHAVS
jgi:DMSO/TMAO reductase YedYZ heme-binding membrane subunit